jgi:hypothetical protein
MLGTTGGAKELEGKGGNLDQSSRVQCVVDFFGPAELLSMGGGHDGPGSPEARLIGGPVQKNKEKARKASPLTYVSKDSAPFLIMHGDQDNVVPPQQSKVLSEALKKAGVEVKLQMIKGNGHGGPGFNSLENRRLIEEFFDKHLKNVKDRADAPRNPPVLVTISKETTYITGPLRKDGYVNYVAALNERCKKGVTPENNAAVLVWQAMGPGKIKAEIRPRYFQMLEMQPPPEKGEYFIAFYQYLQRLREDKDPRAPKLAADGWDPVYDQLSEAMKRPWSAAEFPVMEAWLAANEKPLALIAKASRRTRRFDPLVSEGRDDEIFSALPMSGIEAYREMGRILVARAMRHVKDGRLDEARDDLLTCHRLGRLAGQGPTLVEALVGIAVDGMACAGEQAVLQSAALDARQITKFREELDELPPMASMADKTEVAERFFFLDCATRCSREGFKSLGRIMTLGGVTGSTPEILSDATMRRAVDWDLILRSGNSWYDRMVAAGRRPTRHERRAEFEKLEKAIKAMKADVTVTSLALSLLADGPRQSYSKRVGNLFVGLGVPGLTLVFNAEDRGNIQFELARLGFSLAAYHADHGTYPGQLSELAPRYVAKLPVDIFANDAPLHYQRQGGGYLLYSVGANGRDDGGRGYNDRKGDEDWDDLSIRVQ